MNNSVEGIILSAGMSERAKAFKPALPLGGKPVLEHCIDNMIDAVCRIIVVCGYHAEQTYAITTEYPQVKMVMNPDYESGMFSSVQTGCKKTLADYVFVLPGDMPLVNPSVYEALLTVMRETHGDVLIPSFNSKLGHPVLMSRRVIDTICAAPHDSNLRFELSQYSPIDVPVEDFGILEDLDTPADYEQMKLHFC